MPAKVFLCIKIGTQNESDIIARMGTTVYNGVRHVPSLYIYF